MDARYSSPMSITPEMLPIGAYIQFFFLAVNTLNSPFTKCSQRSLLVTVLAWVLLRFFVYNLKPKGRRERKRCAVRHAGS